MLDAMDFAEKHGRLPRLGEPTPPWHYRGFLLPYVILGDTSGRWNYHLRTLDAGRLLEEPIPQIHFGRPDPRALAALPEWARLVGWDMGGWSDFVTLLDWLLWSLRLADEPPARVSEAAAEKLYRTVNLGLLLNSPYDYLGTHVAQHKAGGWNPTAFYPTPHAVVECMTGILQHDLITAAGGPGGRDPRTLSVCDPCVGSGRMLLHASNFSLRLHGQDIDHVALAMCKINGALYAPWMAFGLPESIFAEEKVAS